MRLTSPEELTHKTLELGMKDLQELHKFVPLFLVYIALGFRFFTNYAIRFMGIPPQQTQYLSSLIKIVWCIKILFGFLVDKLDHRYKLWLIFSSLVGITGYAICAFHNSVVFVISGLTLVNLSMTLSDIVVDACMVILYQKTDLDPSVIQPYGWVSLYFGVFLGYFVGGFVYNYEYFYLIWMAAPILTFVCAFYLPRYTKSAHTFNFKYNNVIFNKRTGTLVLFLLASRFAPSYSVGLDLFRKSVGIRVSNISWSKATGAVLAMFSSLAFKMTLSKSSVITQLLVVQLLQMLLCVLDAISLEIHKIALMIAIDCLDQVCTALYMLIIMIFAMSICPKGYEAFYLSLIMTAYNFGNEIGEVLGGGGAVFHFLNIDNSFDNLIHAIVIKGAWTATSCIILAGF